MSTITIKDFIEQVKGLPEDTPIHIFTKGLCGEIKNVQYISGFTNGNGILSLENIIEELKQADKDLPWSDYTTKFIINDGFRDWNSPSVQTSMELNLLHSESGKLVENIGLSGKQILYIVSEYIEHCIRAGIPIITDDEIMEVGRKARELKGGKIGQNQKNNI